MITILQTKIPILMPPDSGSDGKQRYKIIHESFFSFANRFPFPANSNDQSTEAPSANEWNPSANDSEKERECRARFHFLEQRILQRIPGNLAPCGVASRL